MWTEIDNGLEATFVFPDFARAFAFMTEVAFHAERQQHHPDWSNTWNRVSIRLTTHDAGGVVTEKDHKLARTIGNIYKAYQAAEG
jgi:4a-hydroxytetrahydrobiopterin dehydratase